MLDFLNSASERAADRYRVFLLGLRGLTEGMEPSRDVRVLSALREQGSVLAHNYLAAEMELYRSDLFDMQKAADEAAQTHLTGEFQESPWDSSGDGVADWFINELGAQVWRDINALVHNRRVAIFSDRLGRKYDASKHVRETARSGLLSFGVAMYAVSAGTLGAQNFTITHPEPDHQHAGLAVTIDELASPELANEVFHPNSRAFLQAEV